MVSTLRDPHELGPEDIVLSHFSLAPEHPIEDRVASAAAAGFSGIGLYLGHYRSLEASGFAPHGLRDLLEAHDVCLAEIEVVRGWASGVDDTEREEVAWRMADAFGCRYLQAIGPHTGDVADAGRAYAGLCDRAAEHGLVVGLEFLPFTNIRTAAEAFAIVELADRPNGGVCVDTWHLVRGATDVEQLLHLPPERILGVQLSDGAEVPEEPDYLRDCLENRLPPGDGAFDLLRIVALLRQIGASVPWSVEVCSARTWGTTGGAPVRRLAEATRDVLGLSNN